MDVSGGRTRSKEKHRRTQGAAGDRRSNATEESKGKSGSA